MFFLKVGSYEAGSYELVSDGLSESEMEYYARQFDVDNHSSSNDETILELENTDEEKGTIELEI